MRTFVGILCCVADNEGEWLTWPQAADLAGCPVSTIDWYVRRGRIRNRPRRGSRPSLHRESVAEFVTWWQQEQDRRASAPQQRKPARRVSGADGRRQRALRIHHDETHHTPEFEGWVCIAQAMTDLKASESGTVRMLEAADVDTVKRAGRRWYRENQVQQVATERRRWISETAAAELVGCSRQVIRARARAGEITRRDGPRTLPSIDRESALAFRDVWQARRRARAETAEQGRQARQLAAPPTMDGHVWLDTTTTALVLDVSPSLVRRLAQADRLPYIERGGRRWFRRDLVEQIAAARTARMRTAGATN